MTPCSIELLCVATIFDSLDANTASQYTYVNETLDAASGRGSSGLRGGSDDLDTVFAAVSVTMSAVNSVNCQALQFGASSAPQRQHLRCLLGGTMVYWATAMRRATTRPGQRRRPPVGPRCLRPIAAVAAIFWRMLLRR